MIYEADEGAYLFYFNTWVDAPSTKDYLYIDTEEADAFCWIEFNIRPDDWINIKDPQEGCQQDFIAPTRIKGRDVGYPQYGNYQRFNGKWFDIDIIEQSIQGMTGNERLFCSGLMDEFDDAKNKKDVLKGKKILRCLKWDEFSINSIIEREFSGGL